MLRSWTIQVLLVGILGLVVSLSLFSQQQSQDSKTSTFHLEEVFSSDLDSLLAVCSSLVATEKAHLIPHVKSKAFTLAEQSMDTAAMAALLNISGDYYWHTGMLPNAAEEFNQLRILATRTNDAEMKAAAMNGLGTVFYLMGEYEHAMEYYQEGIASLRNDSILLMRMYNNIANVYAMTGKHDSVLMYYQRVLDFNEFHPEIANTPIIHCNVALAYVTLNQPADARRHAGFAIEKAEKRGDPYQLATVYTIMSSVIQENHPALAVSFLRSALKHAESALAIDKMLSLMESLSIYYEQNGKLDSALYYSNKNLLLRDSLGSKRDQKSVTDIESSYQWALDQIDSEKRENQEKFALVKQESRQRFKIYLFWIFLGGVSIVIFTLFHTNLMKTRLNKELANSNALKDQFFTLIAHDLRSPVSGAIGLSEIISEEGQKAGNSKLATYAITLNRTLVDVKKLIENLLAWAQSETGRMSFDPVQTNVKQLAEEAIGLLEEIAEAKGIEIINELPQNLEMCVDRNMMGTIFRNLISNSLKHTETGGSVRLSAEEKNGGITIAVTDNGFGISPENQRLLFQKDHVFTTPGTRDERGHGIGLMLCKEFMTRHEGDLLVTSKIGHGTSIHLVFNDSAIKNQL